MNPEKFIKEFDGTWVEKNTYVIKAKFGIGETVEIIDPPYKNVKYFKVDVIIPRIKESGIEIHYMSKSWVHYYHESQLKKVED